MGPVWPRWVTLRLPIFEDLRVEVLTIMMAARKEML
jgi:hypothetical protein